MKFETNNIEIPNQLPMIPVREMVIFPYMILPLFISREVSAQAVEEALKKNRFIFLVSQKEFTEDKPSPETIYSFGTVAMIMRMRKLSDGRIKVLIQGICRAKIAKYVQEQPFFEVEVQNIKEVETVEKFVEVEAMMRTAKERVEKIVAFGRALSPDILLVLDDITSPGRLTDLIASNLGIKVPEAQSILETEDPRQRLLKLNNILANEIKVLQMQMKISDTARDEMSKTQREYFLKEQMRAIKSELGEKDLRSEEMDEMKEKIRQNNMPKEAEKETLKQLRRLEKMHPDTSEASMVRSYLDWVVDLPWDKETKDNIDLEYAQDLLNKDHYGLDKIKERILEFLVVRKLNPNIKSPILCFSGPPGVGKTSLGQSIAKAIGRKYFRIAFGGVKDEHEVRGHRRTYVGAMPGKVIQALRQVKSKNPILVLDEVDKLGSDFRGDPSAALLEVLDPEQNTHFRDNYINLDFDLSKVLFVATANVVENIPPALRDRMEVISISGYTENEKLNIARKHLIHKQIQNNGLMEDQIHLDNSALKQLINYYTREAGLRNLEREIGSLCRKAAKKISMEGFKKVEVTGDSLVEILGPPLFLKDIRLQDPQVGVATGLAWTQAGGEVLYVEALKMKGKGNLILTGQLGEVMKESAQAALSYARSHSKSLSIPKDFFDTHEIHIHLPAGAIPKDGPSAGVTIATALVSLITDVPARADVAMTGEITLQGKILPVGGIKEKCLAALSYGIKTVMIPLANQKDLVDIPKELKSKMKFILLENLDEVLAIAFQVKSASQSQTTPASGRKGRSKSSSGNVRRQEDKPSSAA